MADIEPVASMPVHSQHDHIAADCTGTPKATRAGEKDEGIVSQAKEVLTGRSHVTQIEHAQINETITQGIAANVDDFMVHNVASIPITLVQEADSANERMKLRHAFRIYPKAMMWSIVLSSAIIMEGYDTAVLGSYYAFPPFLRKFCIPTPDDGLTIPPSWQNGLGAATNVGEVLGLQVAGFMSERVGYRWTIITALIAITGFIFVLFFANSLGMLVEAELLCGIPWGVFQTMTVAYAAEVCPVPLRHLLTAYVNLCWIIGQFISAGIIKGLVNNSTDWGYRIAWAVQWVWPIPIAIGTYFAPESPWWGVRKGQLERARNSLRRLARRIGFDGRDARNVRAVDVEKSKEFYSSVVR